MPSGTGQESHVKIEDETVWAGALGTVDEYPAFQEWDYDFSQDTKVIRNILAEASVSGLSYGLRFLQGKISGVMDYSNFVLFMQQLMGSATETALGGGNAWSYDFDLIGDLPVGSSIAFVHRDVVKTDTIAGCKFHRWNLSQEADEGLAYEMGFIGKAVTPTGAAAGSSQLVAPVIVSDDWTFDWFNDTGLCINSFSMTLEQPFNTDQRCIGGTGELRNEPGRSDQRVITLEAEVEYEDTSHLQRFLDQTSGDLSFNATGEAIDTTYNYKLQLNLPRVKLVGYGKPVTGPTRILQRITMQALRNAADGDELVAQLINATSIL